MSSTLEKIQRQIAENPILLYMKGSEAAKLRLFRTGSAGAFRLWRTLCLR
jgi:glutaredoxin-related protein